MKHAETVAQKALQNPRKQQTQFSTVQYSPDTKNLLAWIWAKLTVRYGQKWAYQWEDSRLLALGQAEWLQKLSSMDEERVRKVIENWSDEYPPSIVDVEKAMKTSSAHKYFQALPKPKPNKALGRKMLKRIRESLK